MTRLREQVGQVAVVSVVFLCFGLIGMAALVLDVGSWYRAQRAAQATADAAALAGAQALPEDTVAAEATARDYAADNAGIGDADAVSVAFSTRVSGTDTITVEVQRGAPGFFAKLFKIDSIEVSARASALATGIAQAKYAAPVAVSVKHGLLPEGKGCAKLPTTPPTYSCEPTFGVETEIPLINLHGPGTGDGAGAFGLIKLRTTGSGSVGAAELAAWMEDGFDQNKPLGKYNSVPSAMFNSIEFRSALNIVIAEGREVLIPIYDSLVKSGSTAEFNIIGWIGFVPTKITGGGDNSRVHGKFTKVVWQGIQVTSGGPPAFGVRAISLVE